MLEMQKLRKNEVQSRKRLMDLLSVLYFKLSKNNYMTKPYSYIYYLTYNGILQCKKFTKLRNYETEKEKRNEQKPNIASQSSDNSMEFQSEAENRTGISRVYKLNKSKVRGRAIAFTRLKKSKKNLYFYTISFPEHLPDNQCFEVFNICLTRLRKEKMIEDYLWITERQKNGTLHFHILTNDLFSVYQMNKFVRKSLINKCLRKEFVYNLEVLKKYNGVDIAKNRTTKKVINLAKQKDNKLIVSYLTKYITKNNELFTRLPFHSSHSISKLTNKYLIDAYESEMIWQQYQQQNLNPKKFESDFVNLYFFSNDIDQNIFKDLDLLNESIYIQRKV